jgi:hypothetical protein
MPAGLSQPERKRVQRRLKLYVWDQQHQQLNRVMPDGSHRIVPEPAKRLALVQEQHELCGHFGIRRTAALLLGKYWWHGMQADVRSVINRCQFCSRVRAYFSDKQEQLQSIPISSMGFRWHVDLAGPLPHSKRGSRYIMVCIEAFSKYLVAVPIPDKTPEAVAFAFLQHVLSRFAAPGQVISDNGTEFTQGAFHQLLLDCLIDHGTTSVCHPRANGQAEKAVHVVKRALSTMSIQKHETCDWDTDVAYLCLGYNCSPHSSTGYSPYHLMHARQPIVPPAVRSSMAAPIEFDNAAVAAEDLHARQAWVRQHMPEALQNLTIAQHRDQKRYAVVRSAGYQPRLHRFSPGDYVYVQQLQQRNTLQPAARDSILRVLQVKPTGILVLQGKCGQVAELRQEQCAPCHLPDIDGTLDPVLVNTWDRMKCEVCDKAAPQSKILLCDMCNAAYHMQCLQPPLSSVPDGVWLCRGCVDDGVTVADVRAREAQREAAIEQRRLPTLFPDAQMRDRDAFAEALHGRLVKRSFYDPVTKKKRVFWGRVHFRGVQSRPNYFIILYEDGDWQTATAASLKKFLMPENTQLPAGMSIPSLTAEEIYQLCYTGDSQPTAAAAAIVPGPFVSVNVPLQDMQLLLNKLDLSRVAFLSYPGNVSQQLQAAMQQIGVTLKSARSADTASAAVLISSQPESVMAALAAARQLQPAFVALYQPGFQLTAELSSYLQHQQQQQHGGIMVGREGVWLLFTFGVFTISTWLR